MKIKSIKSVTPRMVYAIKTSSGTFIADGLAHHNCTACNRFRHGNLTAYAIALRKRYGEGILEELEQIKNTPLKLSRVDYMEMIEKYKALIK